MFPPADRSMMQPGMGMSPYGEAGTGGMSPYGGAGMAGMGMAPYGAMGMPPGMPPVAGMAGMGASMATGMASQAAAELMDPSLLAGMGQASAQLMIPGVSDIIARNPANAGSAMYERRTQAPIITIKLRKAPPIIVDREFYNISTVPGMMETANLSLAVKPKPPVAKKPIPPMLSILPPSPLSPVRASSFAQTHLRVDPQMIQNGLYLSQPLRQPAQESINIAAVEDVRTIQGVADYYRKKKEIKRLDSRFNEMLRKFTQRGP